MGNLFSLDEKFENVYDEVEGSSYDYEETKKEKISLPKYWPVDGKVYVKFCRETIYGMQLYAPGPAVSDLYCSKRAIFTRMFVRIFESK